VRWFPPVIRKDLAVSCRARSGARPAPPWAGDGMACSYAVMVSGDGNHCAGLAINAGRDRRYHATRAPRSPTLGTFAQVRGPTQCLAGYFATNG
jgi:hypothetical protein